jgi:hypothetical protein
VRTAFGHTSLTSAVCACATGRGGLPEHRRGGRVPYQLRHAKAAVDARMFHHRWYVSEDVGCASRVLAAVCPSHHAAGSESCPASQPGVGERGAGRACSPVTSRTDPHSRPHRPNSTPYSQPQLESICTESLRGGLQWWPRTTSESRRRWRRAAAR